MDINCCIFLTPLTYLDSLYKVDFTERLDSALYDG